MVRWFLIAFVAAIALMHFCATPALAVTEFCPATLVQPSEQPPIGKADPTGRVADSDVPEKKPLRTFAYVLQAETERTLSHASMIADTNHGWFAWDVKDVSLSQITADDIGGHQIRDTYRSNGLSVSFPMTVEVRHAWVTRAQTSGEKALGWDAQGDFSCTVPAYKDRNDADETGGPIAAPSEAPVVQLPPDGVPQARSVEAPFPVSCSIPFKQAVVKRAKQAGYPANDHVPTEEKVEVDVAVGDRNDVLDAWVYKPSAVQDFNFIAVRTAVASSYESAISYCQIVGGFYLFRVDFMP